MTDDFSRLASELVEKAGRAGMMLATAESCTGGLIAAAITDAAGSSAIFERGFVSYSNEAKQDMLGVDVETLRAHGAVSAETAREMAFGALARSKADVAVAVTGIAGPGGGSVEKPVGLVYLAVAQVEEETHVVEHRFGAIGRERVRHDTVMAALRAFLTAIN